MSEQTATPKLSGQFSKALVYAELKHHNQVRKGGTEAQANFGNEVWRIVDECGDTVEIPKPPWRGRHCSTS
jgi:hypothetical protein